MDLGSDVKNSPKLTGVTAFGLSPGGVTSDRVTDRWSSAAVVLVVAAAIALVGAFTQPFLRAEFSAQLPTWMPDALAERVRLWMIQAGKLPVGDQYLWGVIRTLLVRQ